MLRVMLLQRETQEPRTKNPGPELRIRAWTLEEPRLPLPSTRYPCLHARFPPATRMQCKTDGFAPTRGVGVHQNLKHNQIVGPVVGIILYL